MSDSDGSSSDDGNDVPQPEASAPSPPPPPVTSSNIRVYPPEVEFQGIEQGVLYVLTISIQNISPQARRFQVIPPSTRHFVLNYAPVAAIASGLDIKAEVEFQMAAGDTRDYHDTVVILSGDERIELPLHAYIPAPRFEFDSFANFGMMCQGSTNSLSVEIRNEGFADGTFRVEVPESLADVLSIEPTEGMLIPRNAARTLARPVELDSDDEKEAGEARGACPCQ